MISRSLAPEQTSTNASEFVAKYPQIIMHICLLPTETLFHIFAIIDADPGKNSRVTIAALARTCRTFKEPALDILWKNTNGFKPLLACLRPNARRITRRMVVS
jgi:hypothetical protein